MSSWDVPAPPLPSQTSTMPESAPRVVRRGELEHVLESARTTSDEIVTATAAQREAALAAEREREAALATEREREAREHEAREAREAALHEQIAALDATTSELRQDAVLRAAKWGLGLLGLGLLAQWLSPPKQQNSRRRTKRNWS